MIRPKQYLLNKAKADEAEYAMWGETLYGQWGRFGALWRAVAVELLATLPFGDRPLRRWAEDQGWRP